MAAFSRRCRTKLPDRMEFPPSDGRCAGVPAVLFAPKGMVRWKKGVDPQRPFADNSGRSVTPCPDARMPVPAARQRDRRIGTG